MKKLSREEGEALKNCGLFAGCSLDFISILEENTSVHINHLSGNERVFRIEDNAEEIAIILAGRARVEKVMSNGNAIGMAVKKPGDLLGQAAVFCRAHAYPCDIIAMENVDVIYLPKAVLMELFAKDEKILENFLEEISNMTFMLQQKVNLLSHSGIAAKIACYLMEQSRQLETDIIPLPGSITTFASVLNVSRTSLHREIAGLKKSGAIRMSGEGIEILDREKLRELCEL